MNRREALRIVGGATVGGVALRIGGLGALVNFGSGFACSKDQLVASAKDILDAVRQAQPYVADLLPAKAAIFATLVGNAESLVTAISKSDKTQALQLVADISPVFSDIARSLNGKREVLTILALADIGLHYLANHITVPRTSRQSPAMRRIAEFKQEKEWGCQYRPDKCKD